MHIRSIECGKPFLFFTFFDMIRSRWSKPTNILLSFFSHLKIHRFTNNFFRTIRGALSKGSTVSFVIIYNVTTDYCNPIIHLNHVFFRDYKSFVLQLIRVIHLHNNLTILLIILTHIICHIIYISWKLNLFTDSSTNHFVSSLQRIVPASHGFQEVCHRDVGN
jgi:hypothetical protein